MASNPTAAVTFVFGLAVGLFLYRNLQRIIEMVRTLVKVGLVVFAIGMFCLFMWPQSTVRILCNSNPTLCLPQSAASR